MADVVVFGTVAADVVLRVPAIPRPGDHVMAEPLGWRLGGGSANVACGLAAGGHRVELVGPIGADAMGTALREELERRAVGTRHLIQTDRPAPRTLIFLEPDGERTIVGIDHRSAADAYPLADVPEVGPVAGVYVETWRRFPVSIADRYPDALLAVNAPESDERAWPASVIVASETRLPFGWHERPFERAAEIAGGRLDWLVVTRGVRGADAYGRSGTRHVDAVPARQVDATGAGDAFLAGLMSGLLAGRDVEAAMGLGAAWAAATVEVLQSVPPDWLGAIEAPVS